MSDIKLIGRKDLIAFQLGDKLENSSDLFKLNVWVLGKEITEDDDVAYLKSMIHYVIDDITQDKDLGIYARYFENLSPSEVHNFIISTRLLESDNYDIEDDSIYPNHNVLNWGPNTDSVCSFIIPIDDKYYLTLSFNDSEVVHYAEIALHEFDGVLKEFISYAKQRL